MKESHFYKFCQIVKNESEMTPIISVEELESRIIEQDFPSKEDPGQKGVTKFGYNNFLVWWIMRNYLEEWRSSKVDSSNSPKNLISFLSLIENNNSVNIVNRFVKEFDLYVEAYKRITILKINSIGFWSSERESRLDKYPNANNFISPSIYEGQDEIIKYLESGNEMPYIFVGLSTCRICGKSNGSQDLSDGKYLWPEGLAHYVKVHNLRLPEEFENHVRSDWNSIDTSNLWYGEFFVDSEWWESMKI